MFEIMLNFRQTHMAISSFKMEWELTTSKGWA